MNINFPNDLPVVARKDEISEAISKHQVVIVAGDTGSGKTTQIPKICLELFPENTSLIGCTQPRRIAASSVSSRVSEEMENLGDIVGYKIRFHDHTTKNTRIKFMTDGVLLAESRNDQLLKQYGVIILDEAHERSLNIDFLLGYLKKILPKRPDLKLIVTSATIDTEAFSKHFDNAPVINVTGRTYPVTVRYCPPEEDDSSDDYNYVEHCADTIVNIFKNEQPGDILAFLPTEKEIRACCALVAKKATGAVVLPMFGRLHSADQRKIFQKHSSTKIVISTNVAETSITVPGIRYVVDSGLARMSFYNARAKTTSLPIQRISKASCDQRKGRCGRVGPGICVRLYSDEDYNDREEFTLPEIKRANLAEVILQMISLKLGRPDDFPFLEPPHRNTIRDGYKLLQELGAISPNNTLTETGRFMSSLPIDPCISRILLEAKSENSLVETKIIAAVLAIQDPRIRPAEKEADADAAHKLFAHKHSDFMTLLNIWNSFQEDQGENRSWSKLKKFCKAHYLSFQRMREWVDLHEQLSRILERQENFTDNTEPASYEQIHRSLTTGFLRNIAVKKQAKIYQGAGNRELMIFPGSHQFLTGGQWIIAASFLETNRLYGLTVATIEPDWLEPLAPHLVKRSWSNPRWNKKSGQVIAEEKVSLFGLVIVTGRLVNFPKRSARNIPEAREIFIQSALVDKEISGNYVFLSENQKRIEKWRKAEDKLRTTAILQDDASLFAFYSERLPEDVCDRSSLNKYLKKKGHRALLMTDDDIVKQRPDENLLADFPSSLNIGSVELQLEYDFSPGSETDGMSVRIPVSLAPALPHTSFEWLVPGLIKEKIQLLIKGLPKSLRKHLVPVNQSVDMILDDIQMYKGSLYTAIESAIHKMFRISIQRSDWPINLPDHLQTRFVLFDLNGKEVVTGRDLPKLLSEVEGSISKNAREANVDKDQQNTLSEWESLITRDWAFTDLPERFPLYTPQKDIAGYLFPHLLAKPEKGGVSIAFARDMKTARQHNLSGLEYLYRLNFADGHKNLKKYCTSMLSGPSALFLVDSGIGKKHGIDMVIGFVYRTLFPSIDGTIPSEPVFTSEINRVKHQGFYKEGRRIVEEAVSILKKRREVNEKLNHFIRLDSRRLIFTKDKTDDFSNLLGSIVPADYYENNTITDIDFTMRQLQSLAIRIERFYSNPAKDKEKAKLIKPHIDNLQHLQSKINDLNPEALDQLKIYAQMIGEFRISVFSPEIKTRVAVSSKKISQQRQLVLNSF
ncbi:ATP-dependent RNA helicase HrpA [Desulfosediminicola flagellatus]|uniref:ATP-dependent RNA helicase HrpA n=1 Tax=Desulfosediminicola flagellatus TaxID=2569541 RepID=UPI0010AC6389|nr:ATP-dependent RNA helicase HrpA [Desulfosediminicola flagellatus]